MPSLTANWCCILHASQAFCYSLAYIYGKHVNAFILGLFMSCCVCRAVSFALRQMEKEKKKLTVTCLHNRAHKTVRAADRKPKGGGLEWSCFVPL